MWQVCACCGEAGWGLKSAVTVEYSMALYWACIIYMYMYDGDESNTHVLLSFSEHSAHSRLVDFFLCLFAVN